MRKTGLCLLTALFAMALGAAPTLAQDAANPVSVRLELSQEFFYAGDPLFVRISVRNDGTESVPNPVKPGLFKKFKVRRVGGGELKAKRNAPVQDPARPEQLAARSFYGAVVDLSEIYADLRQPGNFTIHWSGYGLLSDQLTVRLIPKFDPARRYRAVVVTSAGSLELSFFPEQAPLAVKAFIDMANAGFYDGLLIHEVHSDALIMGGNPQLVEPPRKPFVYPAEISDLPLIAGTLAMKPVSAAPLANGSEFMILLRPQPSLAGQITVVGQVTKGLDVAQKISRLPNSGQSARPFFKPLRDVKIQNIRILVEPSSSTKNRAKSEPEAG